MKKKKQPHEIINGFTPFSVQAPEKNRWITVQLALENDTVIWFSIAGVDDDGRVFIPKNNLYHAPISKEKGKAMAWRYIPMSSEVKKTKKEVFVEVENITQSK